MTTEGMARPRTVLPPRRGNNIVTINNRKELSRSQTLPFTNQMVCGRTQSLGTTHTLVHWWIEFFFFFYASTCLCVFSGILNGYTTWPYNKSILVQHISRQDIIRYLTDHAYMLTCLTLISSWHVSGVQPLPKTLPFCEHLVTPNSFS